MGTFKIRGMVLKEILTGESGKQIIVLAKDKGRLRLSARGAKNTKSKFLAGTQQFAYSDFIVYEGKGGFLSLTQADILESHYGLRMDIEKLAYASYMAEIAEKTILEGMENNETLLLLLRTYYVLTKTDIMPLLAARIFELKYFQLAGLMPEIGGCAACGKEGDYFSAQAGGIICRRCCEGFTDRIRISQGTKRVLEYVFTAREDKLYSFRVSEAVLGELSRLCRSYMEQYVSEKFPSREFAEGLEKGVT